MKKEWKTFHALGIKNYNLDLIPESIWIFFHGLCTNNVFFHPSLIPEIKLFLFLLTKGLAVAQLCKLVGDVTLFGVASKGKHETLEPLGLITNLLERNGDYLNEVRK